MIHTKICTSIEGEKLAFQCRQFNPFLPRIDPKIGCLIYPFKMGISSKAIVEEELNPKEYKFRVESILDKDTCIKGETIDGFAVKPLKETKIIHTGAHRGRVINTNSFTFAHIEIGFRALLQKKENEKKE